MSIRLLVKNALAYHTNYGQKRVIKFATGGEKYIGEFFDGHRSGNGTYYFENGAR
jgi:hypothetical protein